MSDTINTEDGKPAARRSFSDVLRHHGFECYPHFRYKWMDLWKRGSLQYCEVELPPKGSEAFGRARIVGSGLGEKSFAIPSDLDNFLSCA
jgi:hypothetical protein